MDEYPLPQDGTASQVMRDAVYQIIRQRGREGATDDELSEHLGVDINLFRLRRNELCREGFIVKGGRRKTRTGRKAFFFVATALPYIYREGTDLPEDAIVVLSPEERRSTETLRMDITRLAGSMTAQECKVWLAFAEASRTYDGPETAASLLEQMAPLALGPQKGPAKVSGVLAGLADWARVEIRAREEALAACKMERDDLWILLHTIADLPSVYKKDAPKIANAALKLSRFHTDVCELTQEQRIAASDRLAGLKK